MLTTPLLPAIALLGPTASGKTDLALALTKIFPVEIISVDSALIYQGMDIGTAKPHPDILKNMPHHLINICRPEESYSAAKFCDDAQKLIIQIHHRNKIPLLVGGTMMYFNALFKGLSSLPPADETIRKGLENILKEQGLDFLYQKLSQIDPLASKKINANDPQRILRALEVYEITGKPISYFWDQEKKANPVQYLKIALNPSERKLLHTHIEQRFDEMLMQGFLTEVEKLHLNKNLNLNMPAMRAVGYRQAWEYLEGQYDLKEMRLRAIAATRQLAKRQITWLRSFEDLHWFASESSTLLNDVSTLIKTWLTDPR